MNANFGKIERIRRLIDKIAYYSLLIDIAIAVLTTVSILHLGDITQLMIPVNYILSAVVLLSLSLFVALFALKHEEKILDTMLNRKYKFGKIKLSPMHKVRMKLIYRRNKRMSK